MEDVYSNKKTYSLLTIWPFDTHAISFMFFDYSYKTTATVPYIHFIRLGYDIHTFCGSSQLNGINIKAPFAYLKIPSVPSSNKQRRWTVQCWCCKAFYRLARREEYQWSFLCLPYDHHYVFVTKDKRSFMIEWFSETLYLITELIHMNQEREGVKNGDIKNVNVSLSRDYTLYNDDDTSLAVCDTSMFFTSFIECYFVICVWFL